MSLARPGDAAEASHLPAARSVSRAAFRSGHFSDGLRQVPEEVAVALTYGGSTHAVMMATPDDLQDFAVGFSLTEGIVEAAGEIEQLDILTQPEGIDIQMWLA